MHYQHNRKFGKLENGKLTYAPLYIQTPKCVITYPRDIEYLDNGWKHVIDELPRQKWSYRIEFDGYSESELYITVKYKYVEVPLPPPPQYGLYTRTKQWLLKYRVGYWLYLFKCWSIETAKTLKRKLI